MTIYHRDAVIAVLNYAEAVKFQLPQSCRQDLRFLLQDVLATIQRSCDDRDISYVKMEGDLLCRF